MHYQLIDQILSIDTDPPPGQPATLTALKNLAASEDYLQDHFPTFPVMPGVLMVEAAVQAARALAVELAKAAAVDRTPADRLVLAEVAALKFAGFVAPGDALLVRVTTDPADARSFKASAERRGPAGETAKAFAGKIRLRELEAHGQP